MPGKKSSRSHFTMRMERAVHADLAARAERTGESRAALAERYIEEGLRRDEHPEVVFRDSSLGRRAMLAGTRLEIWQVIETLRNSGNSIEEAAEYLGLPASKVRACLSYYAAYQGDVDGHARRQRRENERAEAAWRREQELLSA